MVSINLEKIQEKSLTELINLIESTEYHSLNGSLGSEHYEKKISYFNPSLGWVDCPVYQSQSGIVCNGSTYSKLDNEQVIQIALILTQSKFIKVTTSSHRGWSGQYEDDSFNEEYFSIKVK